MSTINTPVFRVSYPNLFQPKRNDLNGKDEYSIVALFKKGDDLTKLKAACQAAIEKKWGKDKNQWPPNLRTPFRLQEERAKTVDGRRVLPAGHEEGAIFINLKSAQRPGIVDHNVQAILDESQIYSGCYGIAAVNAYAYDTKGNRGISFGLQHFQKIKDGEPLGNRARPEDAFAPVAIEGESSPKDATSIFS